MSRQAIDLAMMAPCDNRQTPPDLHARPLGRLLASIPVAGVYLSKYAIALEMLAFMISNMSILHSHPQ